MGKQKGIKRRNQKTLMVKQIAKQQPTQIAKQPTIRRLYAKSKTLMVNLLGCRVRIGEGILFVAGNNLLPLPGGGDLWYNGDGSAGI